MHYKPLTVQFGRLKKPMDVENMVLLLLLRTLHFTPIRLASRRKIFFEKGVYAKIILAETLDATPLTGFSVDAADKVSNFDGGHKDEH